MYRVCVYRVFISLYWFFDKKNQYKEIQKWAEHVRLIREIHAVCKQRCCLVVNHRSRKLLRSVITARGDRASV